MRRRREGYPGSPELTHPAAPAVPRTGPEPICPCIWFTAQFSPVYLPWLASVPGEQVACPCNQLCHWRRQGGGPGKAKVLAVMPLAQARRSQVVIQAVLCVRPKVVAGRRRDKRKLRPHASGDEGTQNKGESLEPITNKPRAKSVQCLARSAAAVCGMTMQKPKRCRLMWQGWD